MHYNNILQREMIALSLVVEFGTICFNLPKLKNLQYMDISKKGFLKRTNEKKGGVNKIQ